MLISLCRLPVEKVLFGGNGYLFGLPGQFEEDKLKVKIRSIFKFEVSTVFAI